MITEYIVIVITAVVVFAVLKFDLINKARAVLQKKPDAPLAPADPTAQTPVGAPIAPAPVSAPIPAPPAPVAGATLTAPLPGEGLAQYMVRQKLNPGDTWALVTAIASQHPGEGWDVIVTRALHPEQFWTQADRDTIAAASRAQEAAAAAIYPAVPGTVPASSLNDEDLMYVYAMEHIEPNWSYRHLSGTGLEIRQALARFGNEPAAAEDWRNNGGPDRYTGPLKGL